jgi:hypothetical protein
MTKSLVPSRSLPLVALLVLTGCATVIRGTRQSVAVTSDPPTADVIDQPSGNRFTTPATVKMARGQYHTLNVTKSGYEPQQLPMRREVSVGFWIGDAFTLGIGTLIDFATGAIFHIKPKTVHVVLEPTKPLQP